MLNSIHGRVAATLMSLVHFYSGQGPGAAEGDDAFPMVRLSQNDLASMLGLSRQTINKELGRLVEEGAIDMRYKRIRIVDAERLARIAAGT